MRKLLFIIALLSGVACAQQPWSPFLTVVPPGSKNAATTAIDWSLTGLQTSDHLPPDTAWTQSGSTIAASTCSNGASDCTSTIQTALNACSGNKFVLLGVGTFLLSSATPLTMTNNGCVLRGSGTLVGSRTTINITSNIQDGTIRLGAVGDPNASNAVNITHVGGGNPQAGDTTMTVSSATNFHVGDAAEITELNDYSYVSTRPGTPTSNTEVSLLQICPGTGTINATSTTFTCGSSVFTANMVGQAIQVPGAGASGGVLYTSISSRTGTTATLALAAGTTVTGNAVLSYEGAPSEGAGGVNYCDGWGTGLRCRGQTVKVTNVSGTTITFTPPLYTDYTLTPQAIPWTPVFNAGIENLYITENNTHTNRNSPIGFNRCDNCWATGNQIYFSDGDYIKFYWTIHSAAMFNYLDDGDNHGPGSDNQAILLSWGSSSNWVVSNIDVRQENTVLHYLGESGNVIAYNYATGGYGSPASIIVGMEGHSTHTQFDLFEGNIDGQNWYDVGHGTNSQHTSFRNWWAGTNLFCGGANTKATVSCTSPAWTFEYNIALRIDSISWNMNSIGDIVGSPAMEALGGSKFAVKAWPTLRDTGGSGDDKIELGYGYTLQSDTNANAWDSTQAQGQAFIHGLYSNHAGTTTWSGAVTHTLPASFFLAAEPSWWGSLPYPGIGPDITGGSISALATAGPSPGGHVNMNPAMACYYNVMGGKEGGDGSPYGTFDKTACFAPGPPVVATPTFSPLGSAGPFTASQTVAISTITAGATICWTSDGTTPTADGAGTCTHGTTYSGTISVTVNQTLRAIASLSGDTDSGVGTSAYVLQGSAPTFSPVSGTSSSTPITVTISQAQSLSMCVTTNGTTPASTGTGSCSTGALYTGPFSVSLTQTVKAIAFANGWTDSSVGTAAYIITGSVAADSVGAFGMTLSGGAVIK